MLMTAPTKERVDASQHEWADGVGVGQLDLDRLWAMARRQWRAFAAACVLGLLGGLAYIATAVPLYTASTSILIDNRAVRAVEDVSALTSLGIDIGAVDSQVEVIRSERLGAAVTEKLGLLDHPEFAGGAQTLVGAIKGVLRTLVDVREWFGSEPVVDPDEDSRAKRAVIEQLRESLTVRRVGRTFVLEVGFTSADPVLSARIANAYAEAYLRDQLESKYDATRRASVWLQERIQELRQKSLDADLAVQRFRAENNLIAAGGKLLSEQQLSELNSQLILARAQVSSAQARYDRIRAIVEAGQSGAIVTEALDHPVINALRAKFLEASKRESELSARLGRSHIQVVNLRNEMREYERLVFDELGRIAESYRSDLAVAHSKEQSLTEGLAGLMGVTATANDSLVTLRELEREAETFRSLYQNFLQRFQEATQQQSFPITDARVITTASRPEVTSHPRKALVLALALVLGAAGGVGIGLLREHGDRFFRTGAQVRDELGAEFLGMLPALAHEDEPQQADLLAELLARHEVRAPPVMRHVIDSPLSGYAETLRAAKVAADVSLHDLPTKIVGVVSMLPSEGKSTTAKNFASLLAQQGMRTLLIDGDLRNPGLTRTLAPWAAGGLVEVLLEGRRAQEFYLREPETGLVVLPAILRTRITHTSDLLASAAMKNLLREVSQHFDYVVVDLPPLGPVVDVRAAASLFSAFLFVVEWGRTPRKAVRTTLATEERIRERCIGVVLNKVDPARLGYYESYGSKDYYYSRYTNYYRES